VQDQTALMKKEERVGRKDKCCQTKMNVFTGFVHRRWVMPSTPLLLSLASVKKDTFK